MKKQIPFYLLALLTAIVGLSVYGCGSDDNDDYDEPGATPSFSSNSTYQVSNSGGSIECYIYKYETSAEVRSTASWILAWTGGTSAGVTCFISVSKNETSFEREGSVELVYKGQVVDQINIIQEAGDGGGEEEEPGNQGEFGAPTGLTLSKNGYEVTLSWQQVPNAIKYFIYHSNPTVYNSGYFASTHSTTSTTYTMDCKMAGNWAFKVMAYDGQNYSDYSNTVTTSISESDINGDDIPSPTAKPAKPTGLKASVNGSEVTVSWNASTGASYYRLYYTKPAPYDITDFSNVYSTSTTMNCTIKGTWTIWVEAVGANYEASDPSSKVTFSISSTDNEPSKPTQLDTPTNLTVNSRSTDSYVQLQCDAVAYGYDYQLYRSTSPNYGYTKVSASVGSNASGSIIYFTDSNPKSGTTYYKVKVSALSYLGIKDSDFSSYVKVVR